MTEQRLAEFLDERLGDRVPITVTPMVGGGSCEVFAVDRGDARWVLRQAPRHASSSTAHDVLREFRILDAIKDEPVRIARPVVACDDPEVFGSAVLRDGSASTACPCGTTCPTAWAAAPESHGRALEELIDALVAVHAVDWQACGLGDDRSHRATTCSGNTIDGCRSSPPTAAVICRRRTRSVTGSRPIARPTRRRRCSTATTSWTTCCSPPTHPRNLLAVVDWEMAAIGDPLVDLAWALIFHPGPGGDDAPRHGQGAARSRCSTCRARPRSSTRYAERSGRDVADIGWYDVFSRWKLGIVLEGSYAKFVRGQSDKPIHEFFGTQVDLLLASATEIIERGDA